jgi:anti-sigma factor RsiW
MTCHDAVRLLDAYVDHELDAAQTSAVEAHAAECAACRQRIAERESLGRLVRAMPYYAAPDRLREKAAGSAARTRSVRQALAWAATIAVVVSLGGAIEIARSAKSRRAARAAAEAVVDAHVQSLAANRLFEVRSSDQHTVKPWFAGRLNFSPPVDDLARIGFPLVGGRVDEVGGRPAAALIYQRRNHVITVFVRIAEDGADGSDERVVRGFRAIAWRRGEMAFWAVSDLNQAELRQFVDALQRSPAS